MSAEGRLSAELYALTHRGNPGDVAFYRELCRGSRRILELGSGSGRLLVALAGAKRRVVGLECDPEFLRLARQSQRHLNAASRASLSLQVGDMREFEQPLRFERVLLPYNALYCLLRKRDAASCFRAAYRALEPGGLFALDVWNADPFHHAAPLRSVQAGDGPIVTVAHSGQTFDVFERLRVRRREQRLLATYHYEPRLAPRRDAQAIRIPIAQRYYLAGEVEDLLLQAGFQIAKRYGSFTRARYTPRSAHLIVLARRKA